MECIYTNKHYLNFINKLQYTMKSAMQKSIRNVALGVQFVLKAVIKSTQ